ncbi:MAG: aminotransferase class I/II-fold pyridoxal phosphate-dependent enzyme [Nannocystaceae bacterium]
MSIDARIAARLEALQAAGLARHPPPVSARAGVRYRLDGRDVIGLCSNDYLGLADSEPPTRAQCSGAGGSRLICGDLPIHREVEHRLAALARTDDAVLFPSGFQLNVGVLPALLEPGDCVASDALNHASLIDGLRLARADVTVLRHRTTPDALALPADPAALWWVTESTFSMDGDRLDLDGLRRHHARGGASYVDDAHALGLFAGGTGLLTANGIAPTILVGTLGKALGVAGAFVAASHTVCRFLRARARSFVFSTGTSPAQAECILHALALVTGPRGDELRDRLWSNAHHLAQRLGCDDAPSPIFPVLVGDNDAALALALSLLQRGWHVQAIRPPTVPPGTARLRVTVTAAHERAQLDAFVDDLRAALDRLQLPLRVDRGVVP